MSDYTTIIKDNLAILIPDDASLLSTTKGIVAKLGFLRDKASPALDSRLFDFESKVNQIVEHFAQHGLTRKTYVCAAVKEPGLLLRNPETLIDHIDFVE
jgi:hypothetical protein